MSVDSGPYLERCIELLDKFQEETSRLFVDFQSLPIPSSKAAKERGQYPEPKSVHTIQCRAVIHADMANDQLAAIGRCLRPPIVICPAWGCLRSLLEIASIACWILDLDIGVTERVARSFGCRYDGVDQMKKVADSDSSGEFNATVAANDARKRLDQIVVQAEVLGIAVNRNRNGKIIGVGIEMPSSSSLAGKIHDREWLYRLASGAVHGDTNMLLLLGCGASIPQRIDDPMATNDMVALSKKPTPMSIAYLFLDSAAIYAALIRRICVYFGWPVDRFNASHHAYDNGIREVLKPLVNQSPKPLAPRS